MAASVPTLEQMSTGARAAEFLAEHHSMGISEDVDMLASTVHEFARRGNLQGEVISQDYQFPIARWNPQGEGTYLWDATGAHVTLLLNMGHGGALHEDSERVQSIHGVQSSSGISEGTARRHESQQDSDNTSNLGNARVHEILTFPESEDDAVTINVSDVEGLQPTRFLSNNIIDFYIKYLERELISLADRRRFYFFNSFFFTKLLGNSSLSADIEECQVDCEQVRKWSREVNLFEKDYVFIPILRRLLQIGRNVDYSISFDGNVPSMY